MLCLNLCICTYTSVYVELFYLQMKTLDYFMAVFITFVKLARSFYFFSIYILRGLSTHYNFELDNIIKYAVFELYYIQPAKHKIELKMISICTIVFKKIILLESNYEFHVIYRITFKGFCVNWRCRKFCCI